jgi:translation initiation factor 2 beta subunit (eIF-2beta)/eIF-5
MFLRLDCILRGIWRTIKHFLTTGKSATIDGCNYIEDETINNAKITILRCEDCGAYSIGWEEKGK